MASLVRNASRNSPTKASLSKERALAHDLGVQEGIKRAEHDRSSLRRLQEVFKAFEESSGVSLSEWIGSERASTVGKQFKALLGGGAERALQSLRVTAKLASRHVTALNAALEESSL